MNPNAKQQLRDFIERALANRADRKNLANNESLFVSGRLDSLAMLNLIMFLEKSFGIDFADQEYEFEVESIDSVDAIESLIDFQSNQ